MKKSFVQSFWGERIVLFCVSLLFVGTAPFATAAQLQQARVSQVIQDVRLLEAHGAPRPAALNDTVTHQMGVRTGMESRAELTFTDLTITRLGANTIFSFKQGTRELDLTSGAVLLQVPPEGAAVKVNTSAVTAAVTGGTALLSTGPPTKFMVLEGIGTFYPAGHPEKAVTVHGGEMMMMTADGRMTKPEKFDVKLVMETSRLIQDFPPLANLPLILAVMNEQIAEQQLATSQPLARNLVDVIDVTDQNVNANPILVAARSVTPTPPPPTPPPPTPTPPPPTPTPPPPTPTPPPPTATPSKFGTPSTITSPNPYLITSGTVINTDPSITTNGVTDYGKIYRGQAQDGLLSAFVFGSTSAFDTASGFDTELSGQNGNGSAVFKFTSLQLIGDPTVLTPTGVTNLGLIAVNGITSGGPGGVLTFSGIGGLLLATQDGPITLGPEISFSGLNNLNIYARGSSSDLTLGSDISTTSKVRLFAERDMSMTSSITTEDLYAFVGRNVSINGPAIIHAPTISLFAGQNLNWSGQTSDETAFNSDGNVNISAGQAMNVTNDLAIERTNGGRTDGLNVTLQAGTDLTVGGNLSILTDASNIQNGGNIVVRSGGDMTVGGAFTLFIDADADSTTGTGGDIVVTSGGSLTAGSLNFNLFFDNSAGVTNGQNLSLNVAHNLTTTAGNVLLGLSTPVGHLLLSGGNVSITIGDNLTTAPGGDLTLFLINTVNTDVPNGANLSASIGGNLSTDAINVSLTNDVNGGIGTGGNLTFSVGGNLSASSLLVQISNTSNGHIADGGNIAFHIGSDLTTTGDANFLLLNGGGTIDSSAAVDIIANNISVGGALDAMIDNTGGTIGGNATINTNVSGNATVTSDATFEILGSDGAAAAAINFNGGSYDAGGMFLAFIDGNGAITFNNASVHADVLKAGVFGSNGTLTIGGGTLSADTTLKLYAPGSNGQLNFVSNVTLGGNSAKILAANSVTIFDDVVVTIGGDAPADVYTNNANYSEEFGGNGSTTGTFAGAGARNPQPLSNAPPFDAPGNPSSGKRTKAVINVRDSAQLLSLLDHAVSGPDGRLRIPHSHRISHLAKSRIHADRMVKADRGIVDVRHMRDRGVINSRLGGRRQAF